MSIFDKLETGKRFELEIPQHQISEEGIKAVNKFLTETYYDRWRELRDGMGEFEVWLNRDWPRDWVVGKGVYVGSFPRRVANWLYKERQIKADGKVISQIGNIFGLHANKHSHFEFDFTQRIDWRQGEFGDGDSCYWGANKDAKDMLMENGALAMRFWANNRGIGRAWIGRLHSGSDVRGENGRYDHVRIPLDEVLVLFNGYGAYETIRIGRILATFLGVSYKPVGIMNNGESGGTLWINHYKDGIHGGGRGFILGLPEHIEKVAHVDLNYESPERFDYYCHRCETGLHDDDTYTGADENIYCQDCYNELFDRCPRCDTTCWSERMVAVETTYGEESWCEGCAQAEATACYSCDSSVRDDLIYIGPDEYAYCESCFGDAFERCPTCDEWVASGETCECTQEEPA